jgi:hypothetical protein
MKLYHVIVERRGFVIMNLQVIQGLNKLNNYHLTARFFASLFIEKFGKSASR